MTTSTSTESFALRLRRVWRGNWATLLLCGIGMMTLTSQAMADGPLGLRAGVFNTTGVSTAPYVRERIDTLASKLPELLEAEQLDVLCLNELWEPEIRDVALSGIVNNPDWHVYQPEPLAQPNCANACLDVSLDPTRYPPINQWMQTCAFSVIPTLGFSCSDLTGLAFQRCVEQVCPSLVPHVEVENPTCEYCLEDDRTPAETVRDRVLRCSSSYDADSASQCRFAFGGQTDGILISRFPFLETEYRPFTAPDSSDQPGLTNRGITYGKIQSPYGPVHLFCSHLATAASGMNPGAAEPLNATQSQEVLDYIQAKAQGEMAVFLADTGSGPAVATSPTGPANAQWPSNFTVLQGGLTDALLANRSANGTPAPAAACTFGCDGTTAAGAPGYVDHIMSAGRGLLPGTPYRAPLCHSNGSVTLTDFVVLTNQGLLPLSNHYGVRTDIAPCDIVSPTITCPATVTLQIGQPIVLGTPTVKDLVDPNPTVSNNVPTTFPLGGTTVTWTARDFAGNTATCDQTVQVRYPFTGFFQPVDNLPTVNVVKAGQSIPVKFSLGGNYGLNIFATGSPSSQNQVCNNSLPDDIETVTSGNSGLQYDATTNTYTYVWKTDKAWSGQCRQVSLSLNDGSTYKANFQFK